jgi:hypothetical protein
MDPEIVKSLLVDGGTLAIFVVFVLYLTRQQGDERKAYLETIKGMVVGKQEEGKSNMATGLASLDKVNGNIRDLVSVNVELSKIMAVHDATSTSSRDVLSEKMTTALNKLDLIQATLKE